MSWNTIESDPGLFTELIEKFGVDGVQVCEMYDLEKASFQEKAPVYGLVFLFKWERGIEGSDERPVARDASHVFFAKQVINNACATQAIVSVLLNRPELRLGAELANFKEFTLPLPADVRGMALENSETIRSVHNSFARPDPFVSESKEATDDDEVYHFVAYVPVAGRLYELDGLKPGPIDLGPVEDPAEWTERARPAIQARMQKYSQREIRFNLLALVRDRRLALADRLSALQARADELGAAGAGGMEVDGAEEELASVREQRARAERELAAEHETRQQWTTENVRRRHNYVPFALELLKALAEKDELGGLLEKGREDALNAARQRAAAAAAANKE